MEIEKAIKVLYGMLDLIIIVNRFHQTETEAVKIATEALKKQIPKPPEMDHCTCGMVTDKGWKYCTDCGQRLG